MEKKTIKRIKFGILAIVGMGIFLLIQREASPIIVKNKIKEKAFLSYPSAFNFRQSINDCGPYNTAAIVRVIKGFEIDSSEFAKEIKWRLPNKYTLPWGLENQLKTHKILIEKPNIHSLSYEEKKLFLKQQLSQEKPVIILGEKNDFQHYITLLGFDTSKDEFYLYDSLHDKDSKNPSLTLDDNGYLPGNRTLSSEALMLFWRGGGLYGIYGWYALVTSN